MRILSQRLKRGITSEYRAAYAITPRFMWVSGEYEDARAGRVDGSRAFLRARVHALQEAVRWGDVQIYFMAPGVISWMVPVVDQYRLIGGMAGGEVLADSQSGDVADAVDHLVRQGTSLEAARRYLAGLPAWSLSRCQEAADRLFQIVYQMTGFKPILLQEQKARAEQQKQIAEEALARKANGPRGFFGSGEKELLSLIRAGDRKGARKILNQILGGVFLQSANLTTIRALMIEMMGHLARRAVEDSPYFEPIMEKNLLWMGRIIEARDFEDLSRILRSALDEFMENIYEMGFASTNRHVSSAMSYVSQHYREPVTMVDIAKAAGLSTYRIAHLVKQQTGKSLIQHVLFLRISEARRLLNEKDMNCAEIALELGFCDQSYFTRQFRKFTGVSPARYRREATARPETKRTLHAVTRTPLFQRKQPKL